MKYIISFLLTGIMVMTANGQSPDRIVHPNIRSVKLFPYGDQLSYPVIRLGSSDVLELHFDDMDADVKNYYYSFELRNADWSPVMLNSFDYTSGFQNLRITTYRQSSISTIRYTHYQATVPDRNSFPTRSGNYLLKVFLDGDTSKLAFTQAFLVVDQKSSIASNVQQPFSAQIFQTHQKLFIGINVDPDVRTFSPQDLKVVAVQNFSWPTAIYMNRPNIYRGNYYEYSDEAFTAFQSGKEWRWIDLRSLRLMSDRMMEMENSGDTTEVYVKPDGDRAQQAYLYYRDQNGRFTIETTDNVNPYWQSDYANVNFYFFPPGNRPFPNREVHMYGELTQYVTDEDSRMSFNEERGAYEKTLFLKQGFYNYSYVTVSPDREMQILFENTEGNYWGTENAYMILVYYRNFNSRADELIGFATINSFFQR